MSGERDMSISEQVEAIKTEVCDRICKWPEHISYLWLHEEIAEDEDQYEYLQANYCCNCPLTKL